MPSVSPWLFWAVSLFCERDLEAERAVTDWGPRVSRTVAVTLRALTAVGTCPPRATEARAGVSLIYLPAGAEAAFLSSV